MIIDDNKNSAGSSMSRAVRIVRKVRVADSGYAAANVIFRTATN